jgi:hypothetical protein
MDVKKGKEKRKIVKMSVVCIFFIYGCFFIIKLQRIKKNLMLTYSR